MKKLLKCIECDGTDEVIISFIRWTAWGQNVAHFAWQKKEGEYPLCEKCEDKGWIYCSGCGALVDSDHYKSGYLPEDYEGDSLCPECAEKQGFERTVGIGNPYQEEEGRHYEQKTH